MPPGSIKALEVNEMKAHRRATTRTFGIAGFPFDKAHQAERKPAKVMDKSINTKVKRVSTGKRAIGRRSPRKLIIYAFCSLPSFYLRSKAISHSLTYRRTSLCLEVDDDNGEEH
jgi:hypothetical protein